MKWNNKDVRGALFWVLIITIVGVCWTLAGCYGFGVNGDFEHHSSIPDLHDKATTDQLGVCLWYPLTDRKYAPELEVCAHKEIGGAGVFGADPVGTIRLKQPIYRSPRL